MSARTPLKVSGLVGEGKISPAPSESSNRENRLGVEQAASKPAPVVAPANVPLLAPAEQSGQDGVLATLPLRLIDDSPYQPRNRYDPIELDQLAQAIGEAGQKERIKVRRKANGRYELISGHRRKRALALIGLEDAEAIVVERDDRTARLEVMIQNEGRVDLCDYERARMFKESLDLEYAKTQEGIAKLFSQTQGYVSKCLKMLELPERYRTKMDAKVRAIGAQCAKDILDMLKEYPSEVEIIDQAVDQVIAGAKSQGTLVSWVTQMVAQKRKKRNPNKAQARIITDEAGKTRFTGSCKDRDVVIKVQDLGVSPEEVLEIVMRELKNLPVAVGEAN